MTGAMAEGHDGVFNMLHHGSCVLRKVDGADPICLI
jgi:hypothetical protein